MPLGACNKPRLSGLSKCAREDSNLHGPFSPQGPQPWTRRVDVFRSVQAFQIARFRGRMRQAGRSGCCHGCCHGRDASSRGPARCQASRCDQRSAGHRLSGSFVSLRSGKGAAPVRRRPGRATASRPRPSTAPASSKRSGRCPRSAPAKRSRSPAASCGVRHLCATPEISVRPTETPQLPWLRQWATPRLNQ